MQAVRPPSEAVPWAQEEQVVSEVTVQGKAMYFPIPQVAHDVQEDLPEEDWKLVPSSQVEQSSTDPLLKVPAVQGVVPVLSSPALVTALPAGTVKQ